MLKGKNILVGLTGGISCYKTCDLVSKLKKSDAEVNVIMTDSAQKFVSKQTLQSLSKNKVHTSIFQYDGIVPHIELADKADMVIIAPATANIIAKIAHGIADDLLTTVILACKCQILIVPAMNVNMYSNIVVKENIEKLRKMGLRILGPEEGNLACGTSGKGRMLEPSDILNEINKEFIGFQKDLLGKKVLVTAGGTREAIDPVRYIGNRSSGKMGYSIAKAAVHRGADVTLITTLKGEMQFEGSVNIIKVDSAQEMYEKIMFLREDIQIIIMAAAVADYKPKNIETEKIKKSNKNLILELEKTVDILKELGKDKIKDQLLIGFAAETQNFKKNAVKKLKEKKLDLIVANDVSQEGIGFGSDNNIVTIYDKEGNQKKLPLLDKYDVAEEILDYINIL